MSDQDSNIFASNPATQPVNAAPAAAAVPPTDQFATLLASVKNERGEQKYRDVNEAFNGLKHAQEYIPTLKSELTVKEQALAAALARAAELEEANASLLALTSRSNEPAVPQTPVFDEKKIADLVNQTIEQKQTVQVQKANIDSVVSTLQRVFGADAEKAFYGKAQELGMNMQEMNALAAKSPKAVLTMLGVVGDSQKQNVAPHTSSVNSAAYQPKTDSFVGRNNRSALIGATTEELQAESKNARAMVDELHAAGYTVHDLTDPKMFFKTFGKK
jgi:uncharacterized protein YukE